MRMTIIVSHHQAADATCLSTFDNTGIKVVDEFRYFVFTITTYTSKMPAYILFLHDDESDDTMPTGQMMLLPPAGQFCSLISHDNGRFRISAYTGSHLPDCRVS